MTLRTHPQVSRRFHELIARIEPQPAEVRWARQRIGQIRDRLAQDLQVVRVVPIGSHVKGTAIRLHSDVDILAVLRRGEIRWGGDVIDPRTLLLKTKTSLRNRFWNSEMRRDGQAVVIPFEQGRHAVDVVPAIFNGPVAGGVAFAIPDGLGGWLNTAPDLHARCVRAADKRSGRRLCRLIQLLKWWAESRSPAIPISSFFVENALVPADLWVGPASYQRLLVLAFGVLGDACGGGVPDPTGVSSPVRPADTEAKVAKVRECLEYALDHGVRALQAEDRGGWEEAVRQWSIVFNHEFPRRLPTQAVGGNPSDLFA